MRIVEIKEKKVGFHTSIRNSVVDFSEVTGSIVAVITDVQKDGQPVVGLGFNSIGRYAQSEIILNRLVPRIMRASPEDLLNQEQTNFDPVKISGIMMKNEKPGGHGDRAHAVGAIEMALWDAVAKIEGKPLWKHLSDKYNGGAYDEKVFTYAAGGYYYPGKGIDALKNEIKSYLDRGFTKVKMKIAGTSLKEDLERIEAVIHILGNGSHVGVDANGKLGLREALEYAYALKDYNLMWYEEPGDPLDYRLNAVLAEEYPGAIATGENLFSMQDIRNLLRYGGMRSDRDIVQMDCGLAYGLTEYMKTLKMMDSLGWTPRRCVPHGGHQFCLNIAAGLQLGGNECYPDVFQPFGGFGDGVEIENGYAKPSMAIGIGIEEKENLYKEFKKIL
ncbi:MAG: mandelate racemase/muconate lactonizing enzyme family protein [Synergistaceae bacterium]|jgi:L-alanine-DL-glutamate epimerase-like enolase superfamily enzyme|uniref:mandelate racemase/muconate lactonizing enzyme family protein n=1 Tax=Aminivibrio sp. TaxID=1872489 RepID=UPI003D976D19|nr:mandelate racemase/muconate lactonizing enzyme family protein [Synergistaceae bacterium]MDD3688928.1 mandelate racemase/muconate lactonizing enzyme family protein [Synergistaceae bacterium]MDD4613220.1 mandelate racemase/muconate lactonizing enzyme family protein [Synergistaceae bacterium]